MCDVRSKEHVPIKRMRKFRNVERFEDFRGTKLRRYSAVAVPKDRYVFPLRVSRTSTFSRNRFFSHRRITFRGNYYALDRAEISTCIFTVTFSVVARANFFARYSSRRLRENFETYRPLANLHFCVLEIPYRFPKNSISTELYVQS